MLVWFWLAKIISGRSQQDNTRRGVERGSVAMCVFKLVQDVSEGLFSQVRLNKAMQKLWPRVVGQSHFGPDSQIVGRSIRVGSRTFSIGEDLGSEDGLCRECVRWQRGGLALRLLHRLKMLRGSSGLLRSSLHRVGGFKARGLRTEKVLYPPGIGGRTEGGVDEARGPLDPEQMLLRRRNEWGSSGGCGV